MFTGARNARIYYKLGFQLGAARFGLPRARLVAADPAVGIALDEGFRALQVGHSPTRAGSPEG